MCNVIFKVVLLLANSNNANNDMPVIQSPCMQLENGKYSDIMVGIDPAVATDTFFFNAIKLLFNEVWLLSFLRRAENMLNVEEWAKWKRFFVLVFQGAASFDKQ